jgi:hypothetical protein
MSAVILVLSCLAPTPPEDCRKLTAIDEPEVMADCIMQCARSRGNGRPGKEERAANVGS